MRDGKKEKESNTNLSFVFYPTIYLTTPNVYKNLKTLGLIKAKKSATETLLGEKEKWTNKGNDKQQHADSLLHNTTSHTQHLYQFQNPRRSNCWEIFDTNFLMYYIGVRDGKKEKWKKMVKMNLIILVFCPTIYLATLKMYKKFEDSGSHRSREICNRKFDWRERKMDKWWKR